MEDYFSSCVQCPRKCSVSRSQNKTGFCRETSKVKIALACLHFGEEPLVTVFGGSGTIFFSGCTLRCSFCQNYQISQNSMGKEISKDEFIQICLTLQENGAENINLVTGSHFIPKIAYYIEEAVKSGVKIPFCWNSSAYESTEMLELLKDKVKIWLPDLKTLSPELSKNLFDAENYPEAATKSIKWMIDNFPLKFSTEKAEKDFYDSEGKLIAKNTKKEKIQQGVIIRHLYLPGKFEETAETLSWLKENADKKTCISLMSQYTPVPFEEDKETLENRKKSLSFIENRLVNKTEDSDLKDLIDAFDFEYLFYQELTDDTSWLPDFNRKQPFSNKLSKTIWHWKTGFEI